VNTKDVQISNVPARQLWLLTPTTIPVSNCNASQFETVSVFSMMPICEHHDGICRYHDSGKKNLLLFDVIKCQFADLKLWYCDFAQVNISPATWFLKASILHLTVSTSSLMRSNPSSVLTHQVCSMSPAFKNLFHHYHDSTLALNASGPHLDGET